MRTRFSPTPQDPKCRPWGAWEAARRRRQPDHAHRVATSSEQERVAALFRAAKETRREHQRAADTRSRFLNARNAGGPQ